MGSCCYSPATCEPARKGSSPNMDDAEAQEMMRAVAAGHEGLAGRLEQLAYRFERGVTISIANGGLHGRV